MGDIKARHHCDALLLADGDDLLHERADLVVVNLFFIHGLLPMLVAGCFPNAPGCPGAAVKVSVFKELSLLSQSVPVRGLGSGFPLTVVAGESPACCRCYAAMG